MSAYIKSQPTYFNANRGVKITPYVVTKLTTIDEPFLPTFLPSFDATFFTTYFFSYQSTVIKTNIVALC